MRSFKKFIIVLMLCNFIFAQHTSKLLKELKNKKYDVKIKALTELFKMGEKAHFALTEIREVLKNVAAEYRPIVKLKQRVYYGHSFADRPVDVRNPYGSKHEYNQIRLIALKILGNLGPKAISAVRGEFIARLGDSNATIRNEAQSALIKIISSKHLFRKKEVRKPLNNLIAGLKERDTKEACVSALGRLGKRAVIAIPEIAKVIKNKKELRETRLLYLKNLMLISKGKSSINALLFLIKESEFRDLSLEYIVSIGSSATTQASPVILKLIEKEKDLKAKLSYLTLFRKIDKAAADKELLRYIEQSNAEDELLVLLGKMKEEGKIAVPYLVKCLKDESKDKKTRLLCLQSLFKIDVDKATSLSELFINNSQFKEDVLVILSEMETKAFKIIPKLVSLIRNEKEHIACTQYINTLLKISGNDFNELEQITKEIRMELLNTNNSLKKKERTLKRAEFMLACFKDEEFLDSFQLFGRSQANEHLGIIRSLENAITQYRNPKKDFQEEDSLESVKNNNNYKKPLHQKKKPQNPYPTRFEDEPSSYETRIKESPISKYESNKQARPEITTAKYFAFGIGAGAMFVYLIFGFAFYFIPTFAAYFNKHKQFVAILILNFFGGWTVVGWVGALVWAFIQGENQGNPRNSGRHISKREEYDSSESRTSAQQRKVTRTSGTRTAVRNSRIRRKQ